MCICLRLEINSQATKAKKKNSKNLKICQNQQKRKKHEKKNAFEFPPAKMHTHVTHAEHDGPTRHEGFQALPGPQRAMVGGRVALHRRGWGRGGRKATGRSRAGWARGPKGSPPPPAGPRRHPGPPPGAARHTAIRRVTHLFGDGSRIHPIYELWHQRCQNEHEYSQKLWTG